MPLSTAPKRLDTNTVSCHVWHMQVIGLCRFSYLGHGGFQVVEEDMDVRAAYLYAPDRMEERMRTFEMITLPSIRAQTDGDFVFLIVIGERMPEPWLSRLHDMTRDVPQIAIRAYPPRRHRRIMQKAINEFRDFGNEPCLQFRLDDDDAVGVDYVERTRETASDLAAFSRTHGNIAIDFNRGFSAPVSIERAMSFEDLVFLAANDDDSFARYEAMQELVVGHLGKAAEGSLDEAERE